jgi:hypothetical protein
MEGGLWDSDIYYIMVKRGKVIPVTGLGLVPWVGEIFLYSTVAV